MLHLFSVILYQLDYTVFVIYVNISVNSAITEMPNSLCQEISVYEF